MTDKEALAKRWEADVLDDATTTHDTGIFLGGKIKIYAEVLQIRNGDVTAALAIKDAMYPELDIEMSCQDGKWLVELSKPEHRDYFVVPTIDGRSTTLSHAIMAALVRVTKEGE